MFKNLAKNHFWLLWLTGAIFSISVALLMWLPKFGQLPMGLNRDEAALGYNAYSILKTGKDEWGNSLPVSITSFGDQKLPGYTYFLIPFLIAFDLKIWVVRLPSLLAGVSVVICLGLLAVQLAKLAKIKKNLQLIFSWLAMIITAISPWQMHFSRVAYETHLAMGFFLEGLVLFLFAIDGSSFIQHRIKQRTLLWGASLLIALSALTYHSYQIFLPLFVVALGIIFFQQLKKIDKLSLVGSVIILAISVWLLSSGGVFSANKVKGKGLNPYTEDNLTADVLAMRVPSNIPDSIERIGFNKLFSFTKLLSQNYFSTISGTFFFSHGSGHGDHNPGNGNNLHLYAAPFIVLGLLALWENRKKKSAQLLLAWVIFALLPSSMTINPLLEVRIATVFPVLNMLTAIEVIYGLSFLKPQLRWIGGGALVFTMLVSAYSTFIFYTKLTPKIAVDNTPYHKLAKQLYIYQQESGFVLTQSPTSSPYIWYLFENKIDPEFVQQHTIHYGTTDEGFSHVKQIGNVFFESINWEDLAQRAAVDPYVLILKPEEFPREKWRDRNFMKIDEIKNQNNDVIYEIWRYHPQQ